MIRFGKAVSPKPLERLRIAGGRRADASLSGFPLGRSSRRGWSRTDRLPQGVAGDYFLGLTQTSPV